MRYLGRAGLSRRWRRVATGELGDPAGVHRARFPFLKTIDEDHFTLRPGVRLAQLSSPLSPELVTQGQCPDLQRASRAAGTHTPDGLGTRPVSQ